MSPAVEFRAFLDTIDASVPAGLEIHVILDDVSTHKTPLIHRWLARHPRHHLHFTPTSTSWINLVERFFALLTEKQERRGAHRSATERETAILRYLDIHNEDPKPIIWTKTADQILANLARFCQRTLDSGHWRSMTSRTASAAPGSNRRTSKTVTASIRSTPSRQPCMY